MSETNLEIVSVTRDGDIFMVTAREPSPPSPPPERLWECQYPDNSVCPNCGLCPTDRHIDGRPVGWHRTCWREFQIKMLRGVIARLHSTDSYALNSERAEMWKQIQNQLAELYPERRDAT